MESAYYVSLLLNFKFSMNVDLFVMMIRRWAYCGTSFALSAISCHSYGNFI